MTPIRSRSLLQFIANACNVCRRLGLPRSWGQIYGALFFSAEPLSLDDLVQRLGISKASASIGTRQLAAWGAIRQVWVLGSRRDYFEVVPEVTDILRGLYRDFLKPRLAHSQRRFDDLFASLEGDLAGGLLSREEGAVCQERLRSLSRAYRKLQSAAPLLERFL